MADNTKTDVNAEFRQSKRDQITSALATAKNDAERAEALRERVTRETASGKLTALGNNRYRVNEGWDRDEVIYIDTAQRTLSMDEIESAITGAHGLDTTTDGRTALYVAGEPAWHAFGQHYNVPLSNVGAILHESGLDFTVGLTPQGGFNPVTQEWEEAGEGMFHTRRMDTGTVLGAVGKIYTPFQNVDAFNFLDVLFADNEVVCRSAGSFRGGRRVFVTVELPDELIVDPNGFADHIRQYVVIINSHDGSTPVIAITTPWRVECANTERFAMRDAKYKWTARHTKSVQDRVKDAAETLGLTTQYYKAWQEEEMALVQTPFTVDQINALCDQVWGDAPNPEDASKRAVTLDANRRDRVRDIFRTESERVGRNAYAAERAVTGYVDHFQELRPRGVLKGNRLGALGQGILEETLDEPKHTAHKKLMLLTR